jgi:nascent polypeptide-associated complex subunit alpha
LLPGISPRDLKRMLKRMGIRVEELEDVREVSIVLRDKRIIIESPQVIAMKTGGQVIYQIIGNPREEALEEEKPEIEVSEEDIEFIVSQTGASREDARKALIKTGGDIAEAILLLKGEK